MDQEDIGATVQNFEKALDDEYGAGKWHCDDIYNTLYKDEQTSNPLFKFLCVARAPAHGIGMEKVELYATYEGKRVRVTMASRFGDVGISYTLDKVMGYDERVHLPELSEFSNTKD